ncbi:MAG: T9SS type A sorting domain-containing protein [Calditrichaeota bacterium]|nr:T9SS type A sorting domain-containing protein [Calditrichota bacterium]
MWTIQQYCNGTNTYGVRAVKLIAPPPATPASSNPSIVEAGQPSVNVTITGTSISGSGFYDPGTDVVGGTPFNHISASVTGGVTVNSVTYTDPTHITLNISTNGATPGAQNITITNPDGQFLTGTGIITIGHVSHTFVVTNTNDTGAGSLRQAIADANALGNINASTPDTILFNIAGSGTHTIAPTSYLEDITDPVIIDGFSQPGASAGAPLIVINGASALAFTRGLSLSGGHSTVQGLVINGFSGSGVVLQSDGNTLKGNFIGTDATGTSAVPNDFGVLENGGSYNLIGGSTAGSGNLISGNTNSGIYMNGTGYNHIQGNKIGTNITGTAAIPNQDGVFIKNSAHTVIGGTTAAERNLISGNRADAIFLRGSFQNTIIGNYLGTDVTGTLDLGNGADGFSIGDGGHDNTLGGTTTAERNIISGNNRFGIYFFGTGTTGNRIIGNYIGTDVSGSNPLGNDDDGVALFPDGGNRVGGTSAGEGNIIAYNGQAGVDVVAGGSLTPNNSNPILGNSIFGNTGLGIDLTVNPGTPGQHDGLTPNDAGDPDEGGNRLQNFPVFTAAQLQGNGDVIVTYSVPSAVANSAYPLRIEFFISQGGQGKTFLGAQEYASANAESPVTQTLTPNAVVSAGDKIVATATDASGNTSEFSAEVDVTTPSLDAVIFATNSVKLQQNAKILSGDVIVNQAGNGVELVVDQNAKIASGYEVKANRIKVNKKARIDSDVFYNELSNDGTITGSLNTPLTLPVYTSLPPFITAAPGNNDFTVPKKGTQTLNAGDYRNISIKQQGTLIFSGGIYNLSDLNAEQKSKLLFAAPCEIRVGGKLLIAQNSLVGPQTGSGVEAGDIIFYIAGNDGNSGAGSRAAKIEQKCNVFANFYVPNGTLWFNQNVKATGAFLAKDVQVDQNVQLTLDSYYGNSAAVPLALNKLSGASDSLAVVFALPETFALDQNYPNPFNPTTQIRFALPQAENVSLRIYDVAGQLIKTLISGNMDAGYYNIQWDGSNQYGSKVASGIYLYRITAGSFVQTKKMILMK